MHTTHEGLSCDDLLPRLYTVTKKMAHYKGAASEGTRAVNLMKRRERAREELERMKQKISEVNISGEMAPFCTNKLCCVGTPGQKQVCKYGQQVLHQL